MNKSNNNQIDINVINEFYLSQQTNDDELFKYISVDELLEGLKKAEEEIENGQGIGFEDAMKMIHKDLFGEDLPQEYYKYLEDIDMDDLEEKINQYETNTNKKLIQFNEGTEDLYKGDFNEEI